MRRFLSIAVLLGMCLACSGDVQLTQKAACGTWMAPRLGRIVEGRLYHNIDSVVWVSVDISDMEDIPEEVLRQLTGNIENRDNK